mmetsp:Transcript_16682/g.20032  ORF Transcript_16682/g.20032 Transcript_16682/m.20032 type:complete len:179 (-) Transcript_16682:437-973(-)
MHVIVALMGFLGFLAVWYWRLKTLHQVTKDGRKVVETVTNLPRKMRFKTKSGKGGLGVVDDPREAAAILMLEIAQARGTLTEKQEAIIRGEIMHHFEFQESDANALLTQAGWLSRNAGASHVVMSKMTDFVRNSPGMSGKELVDLDGMLVAISEAEGDPTDSQLDLLTIYREKTGLRV